MGIFERPAGSGTWWILYYQNGKRHREKVGPKRLAQAAYEQRKTEGRQGKFSHLAVAPRQITVAQLMERYREHFAELRSPKTAAAYRARWAAYCGHVAAPTLTPSQIEAFKRELSQLVKPSTVNRYLSFLQRCFTLGVRDGLVANNPFARVPKFRENNARIRWLTDDEEERLLAELDDLGRDIVTMAIHTGMRRGEQFACRWEHIDLDAGFITVPVSKNGCSRQIAISSTLEALLRRRRALGGKYVFESRNGRQMDAHNWYNRHFSPAVKRAGITNFVYHDLRHTFCSRLAMAGVAIPVIRDMAGHKTIAMTMRYAHLCPSHQKSAVALLDSRKPQQPPKQPLSQNGAE